MNWELGVTAPVGGARLLRASYQRADASGAGTDANDSRQVAIGYVHNLSIRTARYATASQVRNSGAAALAVGTRIANFGGFLEDGTEESARTLCAR